MPRYGGPIKRHVAKLKEPPREAGASTSHRTSDGAPSKDRTSIPIDRSSPPPEENESSNKRLKLSTGQTFKGRRVQSAIYGGVRTYTQAPRPRNIKVSQGGTSIQSSPGHSSAVSTPKASHRVEFEPMEDEDEGSEPDEYEDVEWSPAVLVGNGYSATLANDPIETNNHQKWRRITSDRWLSLLPLLVMPYLCWCQVTGYGRTRPATDPPQPCTCGQNQRGTSVQMVYSQC